jgi:uncharacterized protein
MSWLSEERRYTAGPVQVRAAPSGGGERIGGYGAVFDKPSHDLGGFIEQVAPSAFAKSKGDGWPHVLCRLNHNDGDLLGTTRGGTLQLSTDEFGLSYEVEPPPSRADVIELVRRGDIYQSSFAFQVASGGDEWTLTDDGYPLRILRSVKLVDVAPVNTPAYPDASVAMRSLAQQVGAPEGEVRKLAAEHELRRLLRARVPRPAVSAEALRRHLNRRRYDPMLVPSTPEGLRSYLIGRRYDPNEARSAATLRRYLIDRRYDPYDDRG